MARRSSAARTTVAPAGTDMRNQLDRGSAPDPGSVARGAPTPRSAPSQARRARPALGAIVLAFGLAATTIAGQTKPSGSAANPPELTGLWDGAPGGNTRDLDRYM